MWFVDVFFTIEGCDAAIGDVFFKIVGCDVAVVDVFLCDVAWESLSSWDTTSGGWIVKWVGCQ